MLGVIHLAIGALVGVAFNGAVIILSIWMLDVVVGPAAGGVDKVFTCWFPTHCHSLWMVDMPSHHAGRFADVGIALGRMARALVVQGRSWRPAHAPHGNVREHPAGCRVRCGGQAVVGYAGASLLVAARLIGVIMGRLLSKLAAAFSNPFVDPGRDPRPWAAPRTPRVGALPVRLRRHAGNLRHRSHRLFGKTGPLLVVLGWLGGLSLTPTLVLAGDRLR